MDFEILRIEISDGIGVITISRTEAMNALNSLFFSEMNEMLSNLEAREDIRALIITGDGKAFVAGADIAEMSGKNNIEGVAFSKLGHSTFKRIENLPYPVIAAVNGFALGGGCELALACDFRVASNYAKFGQPEVNLGLIPGYGGTQRLPRVAGISNALYLITTGEMIDANQALQMGIVQKVVDAENLMDETLAIAKKISYKGPIAVKKAKSVIRKGMATDFDKGCELESDVFGNLFENGESGEGMKAFLEKRKPEWK